VPDIAQAIIRAAFSATTLAGLLHDFNAFKALSALARSLPCNYSTCYALPEKKHLGFAARAVE
jgi:hypothetical protein